MYTFGYRGNNTVPDWGQSNDPYNNTAINNIKDPQNATIKSEITSIPSPFARIELTMSAFKIVSEYAANGTDGGLNGNTIHHKIVSDTLDVAQLFFNYNKWHNANNSALSKLNLIEWDINRDLNVLLNSTNKQHQALGNTLRKHLDVGNNPKPEDDPFNFRLLDRIYLLQYVGSSQQSPLDIIGATSPATLFVCPSNDLSYLSKDFNFGKDYPFDDALCPLFMRDVELIKFFYAMRAADPDFSTKYKEINSYLDETYKALPPALKNEINNFNAQSLDLNFDPVEYTPGNPIQVAGQMLKQRKEQPVQSDFMINATKPIATKKPLVLPVDVFNQPLHYVIDQWDPTTRVPLNDSLQLSQRVLPNDGTPWPYLTVGDFLEDYLIFNEENDYNEAYFFNGNDDNPGGINRGSSYVLPLKPLYFDYFTVEDLKRNFKIDRLPSVGNAKGVKVTLKIPVRGTQRAGDIVYTKFYYEPTQEQTQPGKDGIILTKRFTALLYPGTEQRGNVHTRLVYMDRLDARDLVDVHLFKSDDMAQVNVVNGGRITRNLNASGRRMEEEIYTLATTFVVENTFDVIQFDFGTDNMALPIRAMAIPIYHGNPGVKVFEFAVDFGTTNTHIEYKIAGSTASHALDITKGDVQLISMNKISDVEFQQVIYSDYMPFEVGGGASVHFPIRTVLSQVHNVNYNTPVYPLASTNIPFFYEKNKELKYNKLSTNIKWQAAPQQEIAQYLSCLMLIMRNKVLMNNGDLPNTKITWFFPTSMNPGMVAQLESTWIDLYKTYFNATPAQANAHVRSITEAVAPFTYYALHHGFQGANVVSIDIGGGTSDILFVENGKPTLLSSIRFAGNSLFNDAFAINQRPNNPFIKHFEPLISAKLKDNNLLAGNVLEQIKERNNTSDEISFFFSLLHNREVIDKNVNIDFIKMMKDPQDKGMECRFLALIFWASIVYHIASIGKQKNLPMPNYICLSGNGSRVMGIILDSPKILADYTKKIYEEVYGTVYDKNGLNIVTDPQYPKEATCKGGLLVENVQNDISQITLIGLGDGSCNEKDAQTGVQDAITYDELTKDVDSMREQVEKEVADFTEVFYNVSKKFNLQNNFLTDTDANLKQLRYLFENGVSNYVYNGLASNGLLTSQEPVSNTLFFYPIEGIIHAIAEQTLC